MDNKALPRMTRRGLLSLAVIPTVLAKDKPHDKGGPSEEVNNTFARIYNDWAEMLKVSQPGVINIKEALAWKAVRKAWKVLDKAIRY